MHVGIAYAAGLLGAVFAFISGGFLLEIYTHFDTIDTSTLVYNKPLIFIVKTYDLSILSTKLLYI